MRFISFARKSYTVSWLGILYGAIRNDLNFSVYCIFLAFLFLQIVIVRGNK